MRSVFLSGCLITLALGAYAQTNKGDLLIGAGSEFGASFSNYTYQYSNIQSNQTEKYSLVTIDPTVGYFILNNLNLGISVLYSGSYLNYPSFRETASTTQFGLGPIIRYYIGHNNIKPYLNISY